MIRERNGAVLVPDLLEGRQEQLDQEKFRENMHCFMRLLVDVVKKYLL